jgi:putative tryptophan/tyrosine transport system substrate-binding protein
VNRRDAVFAGLAAGAAPLLALAQSGGPVRRIGFLGRASAQTDAPFLTAFRAGMAELRWVEGRDYVIEGRYANGAMQTLPGLAAELIATRPDVLLVPTEGTARILVNHSKTIPIVLALAHDPVGSGMAVNLRQPGGNVTGLSSMTNELWPKRVQLLKEAFPRVAHVGMLFAPSDVGSASQARAIEASAPSLGLRVTTMEWDQPADLAPAFKRAAALGAQAYLVTFEGHSNNQRQLIAELILGLKVPSMFAFGTYVESGGLMSYSALSSDNFRRAAGYVDKILKGEKPGDLAIEQPTRFEFVVNIKSAKAMGLKIPDSFLIRVDRMIE